MRIFCRIVPKISVGGTFSVHFFREPKKFGLERGDYQDFPSTFFLCHSAGVFHRESFTVALISCIEKVWISEGEHQDFPSKLFCFTVPKTFVGELFSAVFRKISGSENVYVKEGAKYQDFLSEFFVLHCQKNAYGNPLVFNLARVTKNLDKKGEYQDFPSNFLSYSAEIFRRGNPLVFTTFGNRKSLDKGGGIIKIFCRNFLSHSAGLFRR